MKAYLIDPFKREVTQVEYSGDYKEIYKLLDCTCFDVVTINSESDSVFVDDDGHYADKKALFCVTGNAGSVNLVNKGLVLGTNEEGDSVEPTIFMDDLEDMISWPDAAIFQGGTVHTLNDDLSTGELLSRAPSFGVTSERD
jgi:hypothetical protein